MTGLLVMLVCSAAAVCGRRIFLDVVDDLDRAGLLERQHAFHLLPELEGFPEAEQHEAERVARDLRTRLVAKLSTQDHAYIQQVTPATLAIHQRAGSERKPAAATSRNGMSATAL